MKTKMKRNIEDASLDYWPCFCASKADVWGLTIPNVKSVSGRRIIISKWVH